MKSTVFALILGLAGCALPACGSGKGGSSEDEFLAAAPEQGALQLAVTDDPSSEGTATDADAVDATEQVTQALGESSDTLNLQAAPELAHCRQAVRDLNEALRDFMQPIVALVRNTEPATAAHVRTWGPVTRGATEYRFAMRRGLPRHFGWVLEARPAGTSEDYAVVAAGGINVGFTARRGRGTVGIDLDALGSLDPTVIARGSLLARFAHGPSGSALAYRLHGFSPDPAGSSGIDAVIQGVHLKVGVNRLRLAYYGNVADTATDAPELVLARVRHVRGDGGRADLLVTGGDVAAGKVWVISECWSPALASVFRSVRDCPAGDSSGEACEALSSTGDPSTCPHDLQDADLPPADPLAAMSDAQSPEGDLTPPVGMPDGEPPTDP